MKYFLPLLLLLPFLALGQKQGNIWYFGDHSGLDFSTGSPVPLTDGQTYSCMGHVEGSSVISDSTGSLLFYTNGVDIWNRYHQLMPNGSGLDGSISATQSALILPLPGSSRLFYVFTVDGFICGSNLSKGLRYSIVDMCLEEGRGDVVPNNRNISLVDTTAEKLTAVKHANGVDYWVITHKYFSDEFYAFLLTANGIIGPVVSNAGSVHEVAGVSGTSAIAGAIGQLKASPNGLKLAVASGNGNNHMEVFDFDNSSGDVYNPIALPFPSTGAQAFYTSFSPDNSKVYFSITSSFAAPVYTRLLQFDLSAGTGDSASIAASAYTVWDIQNTFSPFTGLQLAPNGKIYFRTNGSAINNPNLPGVACDFQPNAITLLPTADAYYSFPNFLDSFDYGNTLVNCNTVGANDNPAKVAKVYPNPAAQSVTIEFANPKKAQCELYLYDKAGKEIRDIGVSGSEQVVVERGDLLPGLYFFQIRNGSRLVSTGKLSFE